MRTQGVTAWPERPAGQTSLVSAPNRDLKGRSEQETCVASIFESLMGSLGPQLLNGISSRLGISADAAQQGLQTGAAALLSGIGSKADQPGFMGQIFNLIKNPANIGDVAAATAPGNPVSSLSSNLLSTVFGSHQGAVTDAIARQTGLDAGKASSLLTMAAPIVLGALGQHVSATGATASDLAQKLKAELPSLSGLLPAGLGSLLGRVPGLSAVTAAVPAAGAAATSSMGKWLWPLLILAALIIAAILFFHRSSPPAPEATAPAPVATPAPAANGFIGVKLPDGTTLNVPPNGIEAQLVAFLNDSSKPVDTTTWFNFDRLLFDTGSANLQPSSQEQLNNVVAILKAYPNVHAKIGGYTDNTGNPAANVKLSGDRAKNVMDAIVTGGIDGSRLESKGYGDAHPVGDNATEEGRAQNRRISLLVTQK